ncbi:uncharacterized protein LOC112686790 isoform X3 [Sipha flava]|uniref:Uncharacterized protein LOC112686790 isoform X3 n=1 Tax=Sipha flava TaxID=143950 RepID=A0A8B8FWW0_9HEMI|nr:uncharacterized protein LOC112686790 isoform X3 [Sipha flava]
MAQLLSIVFKKNDLYSSWGFQVCGGRDSWRPLTVRNVQTGTLACNYLNVGDRVLEIDSIDCYSLTESQAISFLRRPSNTIELLILKRRGENVVPPKRSSSCKALQHYNFPKSQSISESSFLPHHHNCNNNLDITDPEKDLHASNVSEEFLNQCSEESKKDLDSVPIKNHNNETLPFSNLRPPRNALQKDGEPLRLRSRSSSPQFWKFNSKISVTGFSNDCKHFWKKLEKCSMEDLSARRSPSPVRPASVAFYPKSPEPNIQLKADIVSPKKKVTFSNILLERNYLQMELPDLSPGSKVDEEFNKIYNSSKQDEPHQLGAKNVAGDMSTPPPPPAPPSPHSGKGTAQGGPPPPPPPPPMLHSGHIPAIRIKTELNGPREIPSTIQNAMATKDKKPFTYLPGGLDLSEIRSPRMQRRLERNAQTPPSPEHVPPKSPEYQQPQTKPNGNFEQKPMCNVRTSTDRVCLLPQVQHQPQLNKSPTPWMQKATQIQPNPAPWTQNKKEYIDQVDKEKERVVPMRVETNRQMSSQPMKNNIDHSYDTEPKQGRSFKVLQQITEPKSMYDGSQPYNSQSLPLSELRKMQLSDDDRSFMNRVKSQVNIIDMENPRYRGDSIPSKIFKVLDNSVPMDDNRPSEPINNYVSVKPIESKIYVPPSERPTSSEPQKYTGSSIPSRSFRMLQAMTGQNNEEEYDLQNRSLTPYSFLSPEFWQHYNYLKEFHDWHTGAYQLQQQPPQLQQKQQQQLQNLQHLLQVEKNVTQTDTAYIAHVLNTIDEEEACAEDEYKPNQATTLSSDCIENASDSECEVTVTITLPTKKAELKDRVVDIVDSPVDFWQQINDEGTAAISENGSEHYSVDIRQSQPSDGGEACVSNAVAVADSRCASGSQSCEYEKRLPTSDDQPCAVDAADTSASDDDDDEGSESSEDATRSPPGDDQPSYAVPVSVPTDVSHQRRNEEDADSGITGSSVNVTRQISEKDVNSRSIKYQRTCTHSRLFDFLHHDDGTKSNNSNNNSNKLLLQLQQSSTTASCTSGYSSAATTPSTPSVGSKSRYESDLSRAEYDSYYKSWEYACPYFGYDILPSKAFKTLLQRDGFAVTAAAKFKCPKIPAEENES